MPGRDLAFRCARLGHERRKSMIEVRLAHRVIPDALLVESSTCVR